MKSSWLGGLLEKLIVIGFKFGKSILKIIFSISLQFRALV